MLGPDQLAEPRCPPFGRGRCPLGANIPGMAQEFVRRFPLLRRQAGKKGRARAVRGQRLIARQEFFNLVIVDLINIPGMQDSIHKAIRSENRSDTLSAAIGELFKQFTQ